MIISWIMIYPWQQQETFVVQSQSHLGSTFISWFPGVITSGNIWWKPHTSKVQTVNWGGAQSYSKAWDSLCLWTPIALWWQMKPNQSTKEEQKRSKNHSTRLCSWTHLLMKRDSQIRWFSPCFTRAPASWNESWIFSKVQGTHRCQKKMHTWKWDQVHGNLIQIQIQGSLKSHWAGEVVQKMCHQRIHSVKRTLFTYGWSPQIDKFPKCVLKIWTLTLYAFYIYAPL